MTIPRALPQGQKPIRESTLQVFCDARQDAYGACAYLRRVFTYDKVECSLIAGKGLVASLKSQFVCRLELMGALVAVRLTETQVEEMVTKVEKITFWGDSTTILHWIRQTSSTYKAFVANRVSEIHTIMSKLETTVHKAQFWL